jgi:uncharacterized Zn finger protein
MSRHQWKPYVPVAERRRRAQKKITALGKKGINLQPVEITGRTIARTFWGKSWCDHLEKFSDLANRLPRGRTYVRNGSVFHLDIQPGKITSQVTGSEIYQITINVALLPNLHWEKIKQKCAGSIGTLLELLQGKLSEEIMSVVTHKSDGLFPGSGDLKFKCSCPDYADMCKHVAATLYGVGARLDDEPHLLFTLRGVDHEQLITEPAIGSNSEATDSTKEDTLKSEDLSDIFGIDIQIDSPPPTKKPAKAKKKKKAVKKKATKKKATQQKKVSSKKQSPRKTRKK